jgi:hypothetical protein
VVQGRVEVPGRAQRVEGVAGRGAEEVLEPRGEQQVQGLVPKRRRTVLSQEDYVGQDQEERQRAKR